MKRNVKRHAVIQPLDPSVRLLPLTQNQNAIVDAADYDWLSQWDWFATWNPSTRSFYAVRHEGKEPNRYTVQMHRPILGLKLGDKRQADHMNHNTLDNRRSNLRVVTSTQNGKNRRKNRNNTSGFKGIHRRGNSKWRAYICINYKQIHLGYFATPEAAYAAYCEAARRLHGEYASLD